MRGKESALGMRSRILSLVATALLGGCGAGATAAPAPAPVAAIAIASSTDPKPLEFVDFTDDFARIHDRDVALPDSERVARFKAEFAQLLPGFYTEKRIGAPAAKYDEFVLKALQRFPQERAGIMRVASEFGALLAPAQRSFEAEFGPMTGFPPVYLVHSLGEFDGGTRSLPGGTRLLFGADMIDKIYKATPVQPFFHHELFHLLHHRTFNCDPVWCALWTEGLAVYVAAKLNPGADDASLLLTSPVPLRAAVERDRRHAICAIRSRLASTRNEDHRALFSNGKIDDSLPGRFGYYVGYLVAQDLGRTRSLRELAALTPDQVQPLIEQSLAAMAACPSNDRGGGERG